MSAHQSLHQAVHPQLCQEREEWTDGGWDDKDEEAMAEALLDKQNNRKKGTSEISLEKWKHMRLPHGALTSLHIIADELSNVFQEIARCIMSILQQWL